MDISDFAIFLVDKNQNYYTVFSSSSDYSGPMPTGINYGTYNITNGKHLVVLLDIDWDIQISFNNNVPVVLYTAKYNPTTGWKLNLPTIVSPSSLSQKFYSIKSNIFGNGGVYTAQTYAISLFSNVLYTGFTLCLITKCAIVFNPSGFFVSNSINLSSPSIKIESIANTIYLPIGSYLQFYSNSDSGCCNISIRINSPHPNEIVHKTLPNETSSNPIKLKTSY